MMEARHLLLCRLLESLIAYFVFKYRDEFDHWLKMGEKLNWRRTKTKPEIPTSSKSTTTKKSYTKNPEKSLLMRKEGSSYFAKAGNGPNKTERLMKALECYNDALRHSLVTPAADSSPELEHTSVLFANRSAVFFEMSRYQNALHDIELALNFGYPSHLRWKILIRRASIFQQRKKFEEVLELVQVIKATLQPESQNMESISRKLNNLEEAAQQGLLTGMKQNTNIISEDQYQSKKLHNTTTYEENPDFEYASKSISLKFNSSAQRSVEAVTDLKFGDILFDEIPYASVLLPEYETTHCHHCHANTMLSIFP